MKRALLVVSICALVAIALAVVGQAMIVQLGVVYTPTGQPVNPTSSAEVATTLDGVGPLLSFPLTLVAGALGLVVTAQRQHRPWTIALVVAGLVSLVGLFAMAFIFLSGTSAVAFVTPLALVPLVTLVYCLQRTDSSRVTYSG